MNTKSLLLLAFVITIANGAIYNVDVGTPSLRYNPSLLNITVGDTVLWTWSAGRHDVVSGSNCTYDGLLFKSNLTFPPFSFNYTFNTTGYFPYFCDPHCIAGMVGAVQVFDTPVTTTTTTTGNSTTGTSTGSSTTTTSFASSLFPSFVFFFAVALVVIF